MFTFRKKETIFYLTLSYKNDKREIVADREEYFREKKTLKEFFNWCQKHRKDFIEQHSVDSCIITNIQLIQK